MVKVLVAVPVLLAGVYLVGLAAVALLSPGSARRFLSGFASSRSAHFVELLVRLAVGAALVLHAPRTRFAGVLVVFGWTMVATTIVLFAVPWTWHRRFARWSVPLGTRNLPLFALASLAGGVFLLLAVLIGSRS